MGRGRHKTFPQEENNSKEKALQKKIKELEAENKRLKSEVKTLTKAMLESSDFIKDKLEFVPLENLIENISIIDKFQKHSEEKNEIKKEKGKSGCPKCGAEIKNSVLPFGSLRICLEQCGWREVVKNEQKREETQ